MFPAALKFRRLAPLVGACVVLTGCSAFNMSPECDKTGTGVARSIAMPGNERGYDAARVAAIVQVGDFSETDAGYNQRGCMAQVSVGAATATVHYRVRQSEGLHDWYEIEFLNSDDSTLLAVIAQARAMYAGT